MYITIYWPFDHDAVVARPVHNLCLLPCWFFIAAIPLLYSSSLKGCAIVGVPSWIGGSIGLFGFVGIVSLAIPYNNGVVWGGIGSRTDFSHIFEMLDDANMRSGLYPFFHIALLNDFDSFALCMSDRLFDSAHRFTASSSLSVEVYPQSVLWL